MFLSWSFYLLCLMRGGRMDVVKNTWDLGRVGDRVRRCGDVFAIRGTCEHGGRGRATTVPPPRNREPPKAHRTRNRAATNINKHYTATTDDSLFFYALHFSHTIFIGLDFEPKGKSLEVFTTLTICNFYTWKWYLLNCMLNK